MCSADSCRFGKFSSFRWLWFSGSAAMRQSWMRCVRSRRRHAAHGRNQTPTLYPPPAGAHGRWLAVSQAAGVRTKVTTDSRVSGRGNRGKLPPWMRIANRSKCPIGGAFARRQVSGFRAAQFDDFRGAAPARKRALPTARCARFFARGAPSSRADFALDSHSSTHRYITWYEGTRNASPLIPGK